MAKKLDTAPEEIGFERSSGNVFADLGLPDAVENKTKAVLAFRLNERIKAMGLKQADVAKRLRIAQPNVSALTNYRLDNFSSEKLMEFFNLLGYDIDVYIRPTMRKRVGAMHVFMAV